MARPTVTLRLSATGTRVEVSPPQLSDVVPYGLAVQASAERLERWNAVDPGDLERHIRAQSDAHRTFVVRALDTEGSHGIVGRINLTNVVRGRFCSGTLGYDAYDPYAGRGLFAEGLRLVVDIALRAGSDGGMGLHRVEANVQPGNLRSAGVLRALGFRHEGETPRMLYLAARGGDSDGLETWRDHERYAVTREEWPTLPYAPHRRARRVVLVNGLPGAGKTTLARALAAELVLPLLSKDTVKEHVGEQLPESLGLSGVGSPLGAGATEALWGLLAHFPTGAVVESWWPGQVAPLVAAGLARAGVDPTCAVEVWCDVPLALARQRFEQRASARHRVHGPQLGLAWWDGDEPRRAAPLGLGPVLHVDTSRPLLPRVVVRTALQARALAP